MCSNWRGLARICPSGRFPLLNVRWELIRISEAPNLFNFCVHTITWGESGVVGGGGMFNVCESAIFSFISWRLYFVCYMFNCECFCLVCPKSKCSCFLSVAREIVCVLSRLKLQISRVFSTENCAFLLSVPLKSGYFFLS